MAQEKTRQLREIEKEIRVKEFQLVGIEKLLVQQPDISRLDLLKLYEGLQETFKPDVLAHFEAVETFHNSFMANRKKRLEADKLQILQDIQKKENERQALGELRDNLMGELQGKRALDEYTVLSNQLASLKAERTKLHDYLTFIDKRQEEVQALKEKMLHENNQASDYVKTNPTIEHHTFFQSIANKLYPQAEAGIIIG